MNIKIYHQNKEIYLTNNPELMDAMPQNDFVVYQMDELDGYALLEILTLDQKERIVFAYHNFEALKNAFFSNFESIQAAGGIVENQKKELLLMFRRGHWDLPKGKLDSGETLEACAIREIEEETGVDALSLKNHLCTTYHTYIENQKWILKETFWYYLTTSFEKQLIPQTEEDIETLLWVNKAELEPYFNNTYPSILDVFQAYLAKD